MVVMGVIPPGLNNTNSYLAAGIPFVTGSTLLNSAWGTNQAQHEIVFPYVTKSITIINTSTTDIKIHFNSLASGNVSGGHHYITLTDNKDSLTVSVKCKQIYISLSAAGADGTYELFAELTNIPTNEMVALTGSGLTA